jgi:patatin-related protein
MGARQVRELRLALVCYGGVSLAVYMHGMTKELRKLVAASRAFERDPGSNPYPEAQTEWVYFDQLAALAAGGAEVRVVIDVISGTSAGGINGVCLAKALACDGTDEGLRDLWLNRGAIAGLLRAPRWLPGRLRLIAAVGRLLAWPYGRYTPMRGDDMSRWLYDAIAGMGERPAGGEAGLVPPGHALRLFVTTTDLTGVEEVVDVGGRNIRDRDFRHVLRFVHSPGGDSDFAPGGDAALALAARATSSFPGAFPPVRLRDFAADVQPRECELDGIVRRQFGRYWTPDGRPADAVWETAFVDGGVLDNAPFDHAIGAIVAQRAETEVIRNLIYIEPDPQALDPAGEPARLGRGWLSTIWRVRTTIPWQQPLLAQLTALRELNLRIAEIGEIARAQMPAVDALVAAALTGPDGADGSAAMGPRADGARLEQAVTSLHGKARELAGLGYGTYARLKVVDAVGGLAEALVQAYGYPPGSGRAVFVREVLQAWAKRHPAYRSLDPAELRDFLDPLDIGYRLRRLRFLGQGINALYGAAGAPPRAAVDRVKGALYDLIDGLLALPATALRGLDDAGLLGPAALGGDDVPESADGWAVAHADQLAALAADWSPEQWRPLAVRYAGFPVWDTLIFPIVALSGLPQLTPVNVRRFSPREKVGLKLPDGGDKLKGRALAHFGAFFHRDWRENDYLWGRLDGAAQILDLLAGLEPDGAADPARLRQAYRAVLAEETDLTAIAPLRARLSTMVTEPAAPG